MNKFGTSAGLIFVGVEVVICEGFMASIDDFVDLSAISAELISVFDVELAEECTSNGTWQSLASLCLNPLVDGFYPLSSEEAAGDCSLLVRNMITFEYIIL